MRRRNDHVPVEKFLLAGGDRLLGAAVFELALTFVPLGTTLLIGGIPAD
jgi:hypothetical protein